MENNKIIKSTRPYILFILIGFLSILFLPRENKFKYTYEKGKPWNYETLVSSLDFPILKTNSELFLEREELSKIDLLYYEQNPSIAKEQINNLNQLREEGGFDVESILPIVDQLTFVYEKGIAAHSGSDSIGRNRAIIVEKDKKAEQLPISEVYSIEGALEHMASFISTSYPLGDSLVKMISLEKYIVPNLIFNKSKSELMNAEAVNNVSPTKGMIYTGQLIVSENQIVSEEIGQILDSYKEEYESNYGHKGAYFGLIAGNVILIMLNLAILFIAIYFIKHTIFSRTNHYLFILALFLLLFMATSVVNSVGSQYIYLIPYSVFALYLISFFEESLAFPIYSIILLPVLLFVSNGLELYIMNLFSGAVAIVAFHYLKRGWLQFINSFFIFIGTSITYVSYLLIFDGSLIGFDMKILLYLALNALFVVTAYPFVFLFEKVFSLLSNSRLRDLADTNSGLLLKLSQEAPGTFQHSLQVSNMAKAAAREIGGNISLIRAGALYHDIGKLANPQCFIENQAPGLNYHKDLSPSESASEIIKHLEDGVELAKKYRLPVKVTAFIRSHHAKSVTGYFFAKHLEQGGDLENKELFQYNGSLPQTKEEVIVLLSDSVEAASRTLTNYTEESVKMLINNIFNSKLEDRQFDEADISIKDLNAIKEVFASHLMQVYHGRIKYPDLKKKVKKDN